MESTHPLDRFMRRTRRWFWGACLVALPVAFVTYVKMALLAAATWPAWGTVAMVVSHVIVFVAAGSLSDYRQEQRQRTGRR